MHRPAVAPRPVPDEFPSISSPGHRARFDFETALAGQQVADAARLRHRGAGRRHQHHPLSRRGRRLLAHEGLPAPARHRGRRFARKATCASRGRGGSSPPAASSSTSGRAPSPRGSCWPSRRCGRTRPSIDGHISMRKRPNKDLVDALRALGATLRSDQRRVSADHGDRHAQPARARCACPGTISSQYLTSLLIIAPLIEGGLTDRSGGRAHQQAVRRSHARRDGEVRRATSRTTTTADWSCAPQAYRPATSPWKATPRPRRISRRSRRCTAAASRSAIWARRTRQGDYALLRAVREARRASARATPAHTVIEGPAQA